ncbi:hypothetical protein [Roseibium album]|uniref:hypothetical protein n=1 Tax=Roseibium album TaxID=311410 RepID=UPI000A5DDA4A|nr:hypothetical protein [Roseibium album]
MSEEHARETRLQSGGSLHFVQRSHLAEEDAGLSDTAQERSAQQVLRRILNYSDRFEKLLKVAPAKTGSACGPVPHLLWRFVPVKASSGQQQRVIQIEGGNG